MGGDTIATIVEKNMHSQKEGVEGKRKEPEKKAESRSKNVFISLIRSANILQNVCFCRETHYIKKKSFGGNNGKTTISPNSKKRGKQLFASLSLKKGIWQQKSPSFALSKKAVLCRRKKQRHAFSSLWPGSQARGRTSSRYCSVRETDRSVPGGASGGSAGSLGQGRAGSGVCGQPDGGCCAEGRRGRRGVAPPAHATIARALSPNRNARCMWCSGRFA